MDFIGKFIIGLPLSTPSWTSNPSEEPMLNTGEPPQISFGLSTSSVWILGLSLGLLVVFQPASTPPTHSPVKD
ncbi:hypothetical protein XENORESO_005766 [Xenotaenia resolanae]|uniref:Uncharacterized protein n=1 Tax=Xenotaenia resolanae TaxID=208358 RepID=A0ABV0XAJ9_9TELE